MHAHHRILAFLLALVLAFSLAACGAGNSPNADDINKGGPVGLQNSPKDIGTAPGAHGDHATPGAEAPASEPEPASTEPEKTLEPASEPESKPEPQKPSFDYSAKPTTLGEINKYTDYIEKRLTELDAEKAKAKNARFEAKAEELNIGRNGAWGMYSEVDKARIYAEIGEKAVNVENGQVMAHIEYSDLGGVQKFVYSWDYMPADDQCDLVLSWIDPENEDHEWFMLHAYYWKYYIYLNSVKREFESVYSLCKEGDASPIPEFAVSGPPG